MASPTASSSPANVIRTYCRAWMAGDTLAVLNTYHPELTLIWPGRHHLAGVHQGQDASLHALLALQGETNRVPVEIVDIMTGDRGVVAIVRERWSRGSDDGADTTDAAAIIEVTRALDFTVVDGQIHTCRVFELDQPAIDEWLA